MSDPAPISYHPTEDLSTAERVPMPSPDALAAMGPRERYIWEGARRCHISVTEASLSHARHADMCRECQGIEDLLTAAGRDRDRSDDARAVLAVPVGGLEDNVSKARRTGHSDTEILDAVLKTMARASAASDRAWKKADRE